MVRREPLKRVTKAGLAATQSSQRQCAGRGQTLQLKYTLTFLSEIIEISNMRKNSKFYITTLQGSKRNFTLPTVPENNLVQEVK